MKKTIPNENRNNIKTMKKILKPVIEKKRRDRMNQSLGELKNLLLSFTSDSRLQNSKLEKASILDLTIEYLQEMTEKRSMSKDSSGQVVYYPWETEQCAQFEVSEPGACSSAVAADSRPAVPTIHTVGFQQLEGEGLTRGLKNYINSQQDPSAKNSTSMCPTNQHQSHKTKENQCSSSPLTDLHLRLCMKEMSSVRDGCSPLITEAARCHSKFPFSISHHSSSQPDGFSSPLTPGYLSPPLSPCLACSFAFTTSPSVSPSSCHFSPGLSPQPSKPFCSTSMSLHNVPPPVSFSPPPHLLTPPPHPVSSLTHPWSSVPATRKLLVASSRHWRPW
ncbi:hypothetical protein DPEC_G00023010 [Dallia pectoralis]|uniref:Uncharacterized protein n=1 Tax=Dallia pectoralis TaxID=75939 RepID=A0ACC2HHC0_DALPE|nr:hypothetical protein DPEC_G00023010 [Dallia pectoralis]